MSGKLSTYSGLGLNLTTMKIIADHPSVTRGEDRPAADVAGVEIGDGGLEVVERVLLGVQVDRAAGGQRHQVAQVVVGADEVADEVDLGGDDVDGRHVDVLAVADDVVVARPAQHRDALSRRAALADEVDDRLGAVAAGELEHLLDLGAVGDHAVVGADRLGQFERVGVAVDHDQLGRRQRLEHLDPDVPQAACADDDAACRAGSAAWPPSPRRGRP